MSFILGMCSVYIFWGTTYLFIHYALQSLPPFFIAGIRFVCAGLLLTLMGYIKTRTLPKNIFHWKPWVLGGTMLWIGNGSLMWAQQTVPSGLASLLAATSPLWVVGIDSFFSRKSLNMFVLFSMLLGLSGVLILITPEFSGPQTWTESQWIHVFPALIIIFGSTMWALGSILSRNWSNSDPLIYQAAFPTMTGGILLLATSYLTGEYAHITSDSFTFFSVGSILYLTIVCSALTFSVYLWLMKNFSPAIVATHAFINPIVAILLGTVFAREIITIRMLIAASIIVLSVLFITQKSQT